MPALNRIANRIENSFDTAKQHWTEFRGRNDPLMIQPYRTYGNRQRLWLRGRVLDDEGIDGSPDDGLWTRTRNMFKRYESDELPDAPLRIDLLGSRHELRTDDEGYYDLEIDNPAPDQPGPLRYDIELLDPPGGKAVQASGDIQLLHPDADFGIVSDVDDTIVKTGANQFSHHVREVLFNNAHTRKPFAGVAEFYQGLARRNGNPQPVNPFFYVSSSPWNLYDLLADFIRLNDIPDGPILLKDFGIDKDKFIKSGHQSYKQERIERILRTYPELPLLLIGDSGQKDALVYADIVARYPQRILGVYLRDITGKGADQFAEQAADCSRHGAPMIFVADSLAAAEHAAGRGWVTEATVAACEQALAEHQ